MSHALSNRFLLVAERFGIAPITHFASAALPGVHATVVFRAAAFPYGVNNLSVIRPCACFLFGYYEIVLRRLDFKRASSPDLVGRHKTLYQRQSL